MHTSAHGLSRVSDPSRKISFARIESPANWHRSCADSNPFTEFKEIRKEWKARKKEEEAARKAEDERHRQAAAAQNGGPEQAGADGSQPPTSYSASRAVQLPPIGYQPQQYPAPPSAGIQQSLPEYGGNHVYPSYQPQSPYGQPSQSLYNQREMPLA